MNNNGGALVQEAVQGKLSNYRFTGLDASQLGAVQSAADYYQIPLTATKIYGCTGLAFLMVIDEACVQPNAGPPEPEIFRLVGNLGMHIEGIHQYAEGDWFTKLQAAAWEQAKAAIDAGKPVFAKNIAQGNQTSVITAYNEVGYYVDSWHTGFENWQEVIPWGMLGLSRCPCINCVKDRAIREAGEETSGLISLHAASRIAAQDDRIAISEALHYALDLIDKGSYEEFGKKYIVGPNAIAHWIDVIGNNRGSKFYFALIIEVLSEARHHAGLFLTELKQDHGLSNSVLDEAIRIYGNIAAKVKVLKDRFPYEQPRESFNEEEREEVVSALSEIVKLEMQALIHLREIYAVLQEDG
jgi:hypothetical protein